MRRIERLAVRTAVVVVVAAALPLFAADEAADRLLGWRSPCLARLVDRVEDALADLEDWCRVVGAGGFEERLGAWTDRVTAAVDRLLDRLEPAFWPDRVPTPNTPESVSVPEIPGSQS
jgi:hypothetical protein